MDTLYTMRDLADRWGVSRQLVNNWRERHIDFPAPLQYVSGGSIPIFTETSIKKYESERANLNAKKDNR